MASQIPAQTVDRATQNADYPQVHPVHQHTAIPMNPVAQTAVHQPMANQMDLVQVHYMVDHHRHPHYSAAVENRHCRLVVAVRVRALTNRMVPATRYTVASSNRVAGPPDRMVHHRPVILPPPAGPGKVALESPPAAQKTNWSRSVRSFGVPSRAAVPSRSWRGLPG